ncbi:MAG: hypothetical protein JXX29_17615 [Deltaproteobacteria bacterium]|nr:hypothetical protein [Deltaproteobacteria bacterium]MBN2673503.1 hypothetical protein [Deltaproteobacteria bacterium]
MNRSNKTRLLLSELQKAVSQIHRISDYHKNFRMDFPIGQHHKNYDLVILADIITDYYTCLETLFVRISKFFENNLETDRWHKHLLEKMRLEIPGVRDAVLSEKCFHLLDEFLRFRHFKRYYYDYNYDPDKMQYLENKLVESLPLVESDLLRFGDFLTELATQ